MLERLLDYFRRDNEEKQPEDGDSKDISRRDFLKIDRAAATTIELDFILEDDAET